MYVLVLFILLLVAIAVLAKNSAPLASEVPVYPASNTKPTFSRQGGDVDIADSAPVRMLALSRNMTNSPSLPSYYSVNFATLGPVLNQGNCGSCWAFATGSCISSRYNMKYNARVQIDPHAFASCVHGKRVCEGEYIDVALRFIQKQGAHVGTSKRYACPKNKGLKKIYCKKPYRVTPMGYKSLTSQSAITANMHAIMREIYTKGPVCAIMRTYTPNDSRNVYKYKTGVYGANWLSLPQESDGFHAVALVGWGTDNINGKNTPYYIVRNSWSGGKRGWGVDGYMKILRGKNFAYIESDVWAAEV